jgi:hypothetical protein
MGFGSFEAFLLTPYSNPLRLLGETSPAVGASSPPTATFCENAKTVEGGPIAHAAFAT